MKLPKLHLVLKPNDPTPAWYGAGWVDWMAQRTHCYPIPLNVLVAYSRRLYEWLRFGNVAWPDFRRAYAEGFSAGVRHERARRYRADHRGSRDA